MLISFSPDGKVEFTRNPDLLALFPDDRKSITRMTDIQQDYLSQTFHIKFLTGKFKDLYLRWSGAGLVLAAKLADLWAIFIVEHSPQLMDLCRNAGGYVSFITYEDAVKIEVAFIDFLREQGIAVQ